MCKVIIYDWFVGWSIIICVTSRTIISDARCIYIAVYYIYGRIMLYLAIWIQRVIVVVELYLPNLITFSIQDKNICNKFYLQKKICCIQSNKFSFYSNHQFD